MPITYFIRESRLSFWPRQFSTCVSKKGSGIDERVASGGRIGDTNFGVQKSCGVNPVQEGVGAQSMHSEGESAGNALYQVFKENLDQNRSRVRPVNQV